MSPEPMRRPACSAPALAAGAFAALVALPLAGCAGGGAALADDARYAAEAERDSLRAVVTVQEELVASYRDSLGTLRANTRPGWRRTPAPTPAAPALRADLRAPDVSTVVDTLYSDEVFAPASATVTPDGQALLDRVAYEIARLAPERRLRIEGHGDGTAPGPTIRERWPSNWELSSARAAAVARYLIGRGMPEARFEVVGLAATKPVASDETPAGRARNRRIVILAL